MKKQKNLFIKFTLYIDGNPLPKEYFENMIDDKNTLNIVYEENKHIILDETENREIDTDFVVILSIHK